MLTDQQKSDCRRWMGYPIVADLPIGDTFDNAYGLVSPAVWRTLEHQLNNLRPAEESTLISVYLTNLATLEQDIVNSRANLDTLEAGPWVANPLEVSKRRDLFTQWRRDLCSFIGIPPGPALAGGGSPIIRA